MKEVPYWFIKFKKIREEELCIEDGYEAARALN